jgi:hypothetical protein
VRLAGIARTPARPEMRRAANVCIDWHEIVSLVEGAGKFTPEPASAPSTTGNQAENLGPASHLIFDIPRPDPIFTQKSTDSVRDYLGIAHDVIGDDASPPLHSDKLDAGSVTSCGQSQPLTPSARLMRAAAGNGGNMHGLDSTSPDVLDRDLWKPTSMEAQQMENVTPYSIQLAGSLMDQSAQERQPAYALGVHSDRTLKGRRSPDEFSMGTSVYIQDSPKKAGTARWGIGNEDDFAGEQSQLTEDLYGAFRTKNVKVAVSTLRYFCRASLRCALISRTCPGKSIQSKHVPSELPPCLLIFSHLLELKAC